MHTKILYIEDEPFLAKIVRESLESRNYEVHLIEDGRFALNAFEQFRPNICVLDIMLPYKDGYEIAREIRRIDENVPIIFLTAKTQTSDLIQGFESGGNDYIRKPFSVEELIVRIENLLTLLGEKSKDRDIIRIGQFDFYPKKQELHRDTTIRKLSHRETQLISLLHQHKDQTLDRKKILQQIWGDDSYYNSRNLDVYITKIRSYFKVDSNVKIITLKGVGYHFSCE